MPETTTMTDVAQAEQHAADLAFALAQVLHPSVGFNADRAAIAALEEYRNYCRPSCGYLDEGDCGLGFDLCDCPCKHDDTAAVILPYPPPASAR